jgi:integrase
MAKRRKFTDLTIKNLRPREARYEEADPGAQGLYVIVQPSGRRSFALRYRVAGRTRKLTLDKGLSLADARKVAANAQADIAKGIDPALAKQTARAKAEAAKADTVRAICEEYMKRAAGSLRTKHGRGLILARLVYPARDDEKRRWSGEFGGRPISDVRRSEVVRLLDMIEDQHGAAMAHMVLAIIRKIFNWFATRSDEFRSPIVRGMGRIDPKARKRTRVLSEDELRAVWRAADEASMFGRYVKFLLLTGARRDEAARMIWAEIDESGGWMLPAARNKVKVDLLRPLARAACNILPDRGEGLVFTRREKALTGSLSKLKADFDKACGVSGWRLHDLRRTARTLMARAGVQGEIAERCLGHVVGVIEGTYNVYDYKREKAAAYEALAALIERIVDPQPNVTALRRG